MNSDKRKKSRTLIIVNDNDPIECTDSVALSENVMKRINEGTGSRSHIIADEEFDKEETKYWKNRAACLEERHRDIDKTYRQELERARKIYSTTNYSVVVDPSICKTMTNRILECYKLYPEEPLKCSKIVAEFTSCMQAAGDDAIKKLM